MRTHELMDHTIRLLEKNHLFYPNAEVIDALNLAQQFLVLMRPQLRQEKTAIALAPRQLWVDLRVATPRLWRIERIVLGNLAVQPETTSLSGFRPFYRTSLSALRTYKTWYKRQGTPSQWFLHGMYWLGVYPRSRFAETITLVYSALPTGLRLGALEGEPEIQDTWHAPLASLAAALLLAKEGGSEVQQAVTMFQQVLGDEPLVPMQQAVAQTLRSVSGVQNPLSSAS